jgi:hypothetical protein
MPVYSSSCISLLLEEEYGLTGVLVDLVVEYEDWDVGLASMLLLAE